MTRVLNKQELLLQIEETKNRLTFEQEYLIKLKTELKAWENENERPWAVGDKVEWTRSVDWGPIKGAQGTVVELQNPKSKAAFRDYQVFFCEPDDGYGVFWTTPTDVNRIEKA